MFSFSYIIQRIIISFSILFSILLPLNSISFELKPGDLLFQDLNCGELCDAITNVTYGYNHFQISHVGMVVSISRGGRVVEAYGKNVHLVSLNKFLNRSLDKNGYPMVIVGRVVPKYKKLINKAIYNTLNWNGLPYNYGFVPNNNQATFYCSQLIDAAFKSANNGKGIFLKHRMTFKKDSHTLVAWKKYFKSINKKIPEGKLGTNPGMMSRSKNIVIVHKYSKNMRNA